MNTKHPTGRVIAECAIPHQYAVRWTVNGKGGHVVSYGFQVKAFKKSEDLEACHEFGVCVRHAAECAGLI